MHAFSLWKKKTKQTLINIGYGKEKSIFNYTTDILKAFNLNLKIKLDRTKPDGVKSKLISSKIANTYGWYPKIKFKEGLKETIKDFEEKYKWAKIIY